MTPDSVTDIKKKFTTLPCLPIVKQGVVGTDKIRKTKK